MFMYLHLCIPGYDQRGINLKIILLFFSSTFDRWILYLEVIIILNIQNKKTIKQKSLPIIRAYI